MAENSTVLQSVELGIELEGILVEKNLELVNKDGKNTIRGSLSIQTDEEGLNVVKVEAYANEFTKSGTENKIYKSLLTIMDEYKSVADVGKEQATKISISNGQAAPSTFYGQNGIATNTRYRSNFFNRVTGEYKPHAIFTDWKCWIKAIRPEIKEQEETGRLLVDVLVPQEYSQCKIEPMTLIVEAELADTFTSVFNVNSTAYFDGEIVHNVQITEVEVERQFGKSRIKENKKTVNELIITGGNPVEDEERGFNPEAIRNALVIRESAIATMKEETKNKPSTQSPSQVTNTSGRTFGRGLNI